MRNTRIFLLIVLFTGTWLTAQVKIGDNPQNINPASVLELESTDKVLVITRVTTAQMNAIAPIQGALCYNTEVQAVHYYDGTQWINIGNGGTGSGDVLSADPIVNMPQSTIVITPTADGSNLEIAPESITSEQIRDGGINGTKIQDGSINTNQLVDNAITREKILDNQVGLVELANDEIDLSDFTNTTGFIRSANIISGDGGNVITAGGDGGAFYDDSMLMADIQNNTDAINNLGVPTLDQVLQEGTNANGATIVGLGTPVNPADAATKAYVDAQAAAGGSDDQNIGPVTFDDTTNELSIGIEGGNAGTVDLSALAGGGTNPADELQDLNFDTTTNILTLTTPATDGNQVDLSALAGGGGNQNLGQVLAQGTDGGAALIKNILDPVDPQDAATRAYVDATVASGGSLLDGSILIGGTGDVAQQLPVIGDATLANDGTLTIVNGAITADKLNDMGATDGQVLLWDAALNAGAGGWIPSTAGTGTNEQSITLDAATNQINLLNDDASVNTIVRLDGTSIDAINNGTDDVIQLADEAVTLEKINQNGAIDGDVLRWDDTANAGTGGWTTSSAATHVGPGNSVFFADATTGEPVTAINPLSAPSFEWNQSARFGYGQLQIGLDGSTAPNDVSKVIIAETPEPGNDVAYPLLIQTSAPAVANASTGILFSPEDYAPGALAKGALIYQRTGDWATGDFHFLQTASTGEAKPTTADKAFSVKNNKDIVIYAGIEIDGDGLGAAGEVLTSNGATVSWEAPTAGAVSVDATITGDGNATPLSVANDAITSARILDGEVQTADIADNNVTTAKIAEGADGEVLTTNATGDVVWAAPTAGAVSVDATITGDGNATPLSVANDAITTARILDGEVQTADIADNNVTTAKIAEGADGEVLTTNATGDVVWAAPTAGAVSVDATITGDGNATPLSVANDAITSARILDGEVQTADIADNNVTTAKIAEGADGEVLTTNATGDVVWAAPTAGAVSVDATITGDGNATPLSVANDAITTARILDGEVQTVDIANGAITNTKMAVNSIQGSFLGASVIIPGTIGTADIGANAVGSAEIQNSAVRTGEIEDGTIQNQDISATAAVDGTKINPDFGVQNIITTGDVTANSFISATMTYPDYVFQKYFIGNSEIDALYKFQTLYEIEAFVKQYHHLPGVKSFDEIQENNGQWNITEGALKNLEKIEELFLHTIEQEKKLKALQSENESLKETLKAMQDSIQEIKTLLETKG